MLMLTILFLISKAQIMCSCCNYISKRQQKISKLLSKEFEISVYWDKYKTKSENKNMTNESR